MSNQTAAGVLETLTEQTSTHMLNMKLAPELTKNLVVNAEQQALKQLYEICVAALPKKRVKPVTSEIAAVADGSFNNSIDRSIEALRLVFGQTEGEQS